MKIINLISFFFILALYACTANVGPNKNELPQESTQEINDQEQEHLELFDQIKEKDSLLFQIGFNQIDTSQMAALISADFEFYHDEHGVTDTKEAFIQSINSIRGLSFKTWRILEESSMKIYPLYKDNRRFLYGVIQTGEHSFYQQKEGEEARKTSIAQFTHLWILEEGNWKLRRVLSYDHKNSK